MIHPLVTNSFLPQYCEYPQISKQSPGNQLRLGSRIHRCGWWINTILPTSHRTAKFSIGTIQMGATLNISFIKGAPNCWLNSGTTPFSCWLESCTCHGNCGGRGLLSRCRIHVRVGGFYSKIGNAK